MDQDVSAGVDGPVADVGGQQQGPGSVYRPTLDQARGVEQPVRAMAADIERAVAADPHRFTLIDDCADIGVGLGLAKLTSCHPAHLAVRPVQAEAGVDFAEPAEDLVEQLLAITTIHQLDADGRAHEVLHTHDAASRAATVRNRVRPHGQLADRGL